MNTDIILILQNNILLGVQNCLHSSTVKASVSKHVYAHLFQQLFLLLEFKLNILEIAFTPFITQHIKKRRRNHNNNKQRNRTMLIFLDPTKEHN